jgi:tryptophan synthase alpha chain
MTELPIGVGFGISSPQQAAAVAAFADVVIVGSAIMRIVEEHGADGQAVGAVEAFIRSLKAATSGVLKTGT